MIKSIPAFTKYEVIFIADGDTFDLMDDVMKNRFKKALLSLQNIDDRFLIEWNNIRIMNKNEKKINDYLMLKNSKNSEYKNMISLNLNENGISIIGDDMKNNMPNNQQPTNNIDNIFNNNEDKSKTSLEISKGNSIENLYSKDVSLRSYISSGKNEKNSKYDNYNINSNNNYPSLIQNYYEDPYRKKIYQMNTNRIDELKNPYITFNEKITKVLKDPTILKLEEYIKNFNRNSFLNNFSDKKTKDENTMDYQDSYENLESKIFKSRNKFMKKYNLNLDNKNIFMSFKEKQNNTILSSIQEKKINFTNINKNNTKCHFTDLFNKSELIKINKLKNISESEKDINNINKLISENLQYCFNKEFHNKEFNLTGEGDFHKCYNLIENLHKNHIDTLNKIDKFNKILQNLKYNDDGVEFDDYLISTKNIDSNVRKNEKNKNHLNTKIGNLINNTSDSKLNNNHSDIIEHQTDINKNHSYLHKVIILKIILDFSRA